MCIALCPDIYFKTGVVRSNENYGYVGAMVKAGQFSDCERSVVFVTTFLKPNILQLFDLISKKAGLTK